MAQRAKDLLKKASESAVLQGVLGAASQLNYANPASYLAVGTAAKENVAQKKLLLQEIRTGKKYIKQVQVNINNIDPSIKLCTVNSARKVLKQAQERLASYEASPQFLGMWPQYYRQELHLTMRMVADIMRAVQSEISTRQYQYMVGKAKNDPDMMEWALYAPCKARKELSAMRAQTRKKK